VAEAHLKDYVLNEHYYTAKQGEVELAVWTDVNFPEAGNSGTYNSKHQFEVEYGITNRLQVAYYEVYTWDRTDDWQRDAFKLETKYRFADAGDWPLDLAVYVEYENPNGTRESHSDEIESKVIVSKDLGPWNLVANFISHRAINEHENWQFEYTAGVSYGLTPRTRIGLEVQHELGDSKDFDFRAKDRTAYLMPAIYTSLTRNVRLLAGPAFGLTRESDDLQLKSILEVEF